MLIGLLAGTATGALWGLTFIAPLAVAPASAWDLTVARYEIFGLACAVLTILPRFRFGTMRFAHVATGLLLGAFAFTGYVTGIFLAVTLAGVAIPPLVVGLSPLVLALVANRGSDALPWRTLGLALALVAAGLVLVNASTLASADLSRRADIVAGTLCASGALAIWVVYATVNAAVMRAPDPPDAIRWTGLQGIGAALGSLGMLPLTTFRSGSDVTALVTTGPGLHFLAWAAVMGLGGSWLATWCWVLASRRLPLGLASQLIVGETVFGLLYGFIYELRWPSLSEGLGAVLQVLGVGLAIAAFGRRRPAADLGRVAAAGSATA